MVDDDDHGGKHAGILKRSSPSSTNISTKDLQKEEDIAYKERFTKLESSIKSIQMIYHNNGNTRTKNETNKSDISNSSVGNDTNGYKEMKENNCNTTDRHNNDSNNNYDNNNSNNDNNNNNNNDNSNDNNNIKKEETDLKVGIKPNKEINISSNILDLARENLNIINSTNNSKSNNCSSNEMNLIYSNTIYISNENSRRKKSSKDLGPLESTTTTAPTSVQKDDVDNNDSKIIFDRQSYQNNSNSKISRIEEWQVPLIAVSTAYLNEPITKLDDYRKLSSSRNMVRENTISIDETKMKPSSFKNCRIKIPSSICTIN